MRGSDDLSQHLARAAEAARGRRQALSAEKEALLWRRIRRPSVPPRNARKRWLVASCFGGVVASGVAFAGILSVLDTSDATDQLKRRMERRTERRIPLPQPEEPDSAQRPSEAPSPSKGSAEPEVPNSVPLFPEARARAAEDASARSTAAPPSSVATERTAPQPPAKAFRPQAEGRSGPDRPPASSRRPDHDPQGSGRIQSPTNSPRAPKTEQPDLAEPPSEPTPSGSKRVEARNPVIPGENPLELMNAGDRARRRGRLERSLAIYASVLDREDGEPFREEAYFHMATVLVDLGRYSEAQQALEASASEGAFLAPERAALGARLRARKRKTQNIDRSPPPAGTHSQP